MPRAASEKPVRLNLEMPPSVHEKLKGLRERTEAQSLAEVIRKALAVYDLAVATREGGGELIIKGADGVERTLHLL